MHNIVSATQARSNIYHLIDKTAKDHKPITITGKRHNAVLISEADWQAIQETLHLTGIPGMQQSIKEGLATPLDDCSDELEW